MRFVKADDLPLLAAELRKLKTDFANIDTCSQRFISCAGAATCRLGLCLSRHESSMTPFALTAGKWPDAAGMTVRSSEDEMSARLPDSRRLPPRFLAFYPGLGKLSVSILPIFAVKSPLRALGINRNRRRALRLLHPFFVRNRLSRFSRPEVSLFCLFIANSRNQHKTIIGDVYG